MKQNARLIIICLTVIVIAGVLAAQFRYATHNKRGLATASYDRWTGKLTLCDQSGCIEPVVHPNSGEIEKQEGPAKDLLLDAANASEAAGEPVPWKKYQKNGAYVIESDDWRNGLTEVK